MKKLLISFLGYQGVWLAAVGGAGHGLWWPGPLALIPFAVWQIAANPRPHAELRLMLVVGLMGCLLDSAFAANSVLAFAAAVPSPTLAPVWIVAIWMAFALTLTTTFRFLDERPWLAALLGALGAPLAYLAAAHGWGAVSFPRGEAIAVVALAAGWVLALPASLSIAGWLRRSERVRMTLSPRAAR